MLDRLAIHKKYDDFEGTNVPPRNIIPAYSLIPTDIYRINEFPEYVMGVINLKLIFGLFACNNALSVPI